MNLPSLTPPAWLTKKRILSALITITLIGGGFFVFSYSTSHKTEIALHTLDVFEKVSKLLPLEPDTKKEVSVANTLIQTFTAHDDKTYTFFILLQNNYELRPGGGFLGQYAIVKIKNGELVSTFVEDANLLDQRIKNAGITITPPWPLTRYMQIRKWMLRDSNFSPDFPTNAQKAEYFYRLGGGREKFDAVIAVDAVVFDHVLELTGPISIPGYPGTYSSDGGALQLEEAVEKNYLGDDVSATAKENRKTIMKKLAAEIMSRLATVNNIPKIATLIQEELRNKDIMLFFHDETLQSLIASVYWDGSVTKDWGSDSLMVVDANLGALKSDAYIKRSLEYTVDFTSGEHPKATLLYTYAHTATHGDWRTSDYHTYTRVYAPLGSTYIENSRVKTGGVGTQDDAAFKKTVFGYKVDALIGQTLPTGISYELPATITEDNYRLLIQKQSGIGTIPVTVNLKTSKGDFTAHYDLKKDLILEIQEIEEKKQ
ncbi:MAG: DUF4012 domain-containing protein [Candidatus Moraniibacteriota bacterium]|nr:MAG: DUF4012 domain-containing protein [Candidatus Moranbacteria bacterium]